MNMEESIRAQVYDRFLTELCAYLLCTYIVNSMLTPLTLEALLVVVAEIKHSNQTTYTCSTTNIAVISDLNITSFLSRSVRLIHKR